MTVAADAALGQAPAGNVVASRPVPPPEAELALTDTQAGLLIAHRALANRIQYNIVAQFDLDPRYPAERVRDAFALLLTVQPALRLGLYELPAPHARLADPPGPAELPYQTAEAPTADLARARCEQLTEDLGRTEFALSQPPLIRAVHVTAADRSLSVLLFCVHHAVFDGFSLEVLARDLNDLLNDDIDGAALRRRRERALGRELDAQRRAGSTAEAEQAAASWARSLSAAPETVLYPRPGRPADTGFAGTRAPIPLAEALSAAIDQSCHSLGVSSFTWFSAVFAAVVARHARVATVPVGTPVMARRTTGSFDLCGMFVNTLPLIIDVNWDVPFADFAAATVARQTEAVKRNAAVSWPAIVRHANPDRTRSRNPFFSCMIAMQDSTVMPEGAAIRAVREYGNRTAKLDLWLGVTPVPGGWLLELEHDDELVPPAVADAIRQSLDYAIRRAVADPGTPLRDLFRDAQAGRMTAGDDSVEPVAHPRSLADWLSEACQVHRDRIAVEAGPVRMTYAELDARASAAAGALRERGAGPGSVVGLATMTLADTIIAMLAVLRAGAAYLPLDLTLPPHRVGYMVRKARCALVVGSGEVPEATVVSLSELLADSPPADAPPPHPDDPVYVMFTSGSTGQPKGVLMDGGPLLNLTAWQAAAMKLGPSSRFLQYAPLGFDVSFQEIVPTLVTGGTVVSREPADRRDLPTVVQRVQESAVTHIYLPVAALRAFTEAAQAGRWDLGALRMVCVSGEQLMVDAVIQDFFDRRPGLVLMNLYGPTETHAVTTHTLRGGTRWPAHVPIGRPIHGATARVVDATGHLAPQGTAGTLAFGGDCLARGYINDPGQTSARFVTAPGGERQYETGDLAMRDEAGTLIFLGRDDDQVKIRGYRVELGEIEAVALTTLRGLGVAHATAAVRGSGADRHVLLFVVPRAPGGLDTAVCRALLARALPSYMTPRAVLAVPDIPKTVNGKVDRPALLAAANRQLAAQRPAAATLPAPSDPMIAELEQLWLDILDVERIDPGESLTDIGAHSLKVLTALARIEAAWDVRLPMLEFFRIPTLDGLAEQIRAAKAGAR